MSENNEEIPKKDTDGQPSDEGDVPDIGVDSPRSLIVDGQEAGPDSRVEGRRRQPEHSVQSMSETDKEFEDLLNEERADFEMQWTELKAYRSLCQRRISELRAILDAKTETEQIGIIRAKLAGIEDLVGKVKEASNFIYRSPCADKATKEKERHARAELVQCFGDISDEARTVLETAKWAKTPGKIN